MYNLIVMHLKINVRKGLKKFNILNGWLSTSTAGQRVIATEITFSGKSIPVNVSVNYAMQMNERQVTGGDRAPLEKESPVRINLLRTLTRCRSRCVRCVRIFEFLSFISTSMFTVLRAAGRRYLHARPQVESWHLFRSPPQSRPTRILSVSVRRGFPLSRCARISFAYFV